MSLGDWFGVNNGWPEYYLEGNYGVFGYDNIIHSEGVNVCYGVNRKFRRSGSSITADITIKLEYFLSRSDYSYTNYVKNFLSDALDAELDVYREGLERYHKDYPNDTTRYRIERVYFTDENSGDVFEFYA